MARVILGKYWIRCEECNRGYPKSEIVNFYGKFLCKEHQFLRRVVNSGKITQEQYRKLSKKEREVLREILHFWRYTTINNFAKKYNHSNNFVRRTFEKFLRRGWVKVRKNVYTEWKQNFK